MAKLACTFWALMLHAMEVTMFETCFSNAMEDENGMRLSSPAGTSFLFGAGVYTIVVSNNLFPQSFRKPPPPVLCLYEFLVTAFFLEFATACIWTPLNVLMSDTLPRLICRTFIQYGMSDVAEAILVNNGYKVLLTFTVAGTFLLLALYVTRSVDFTVLTDEGAACFWSYLKNRLLDRVQNELSSPYPTKRPRCKARRRTRSKSCKDDYA